MERSLETYLRRQKARLEFYQRFYHLLIAFLVALLLAQLSLLLSYTADFFVVLNRYSSVIQNSLYAFSLFFSVGLYFWFRSRRKGFDLPFAATHVEQQSNFFVDHHENRSELVSAAAFLDKKGNVGDGTFKSAHLELWRKRLRNFKVELYPPRRIWLLLSGVAFAGLIFLETQNHLNHGLPFQIKAWHLDQYEEHLDYTGSHWEPKSGSLSAVIGSKIRFKAPNFGLLQPYLFVNDGSKTWKYHSCQNYCEWTVKRNGRFAVGSLLFRSAKFPLLAMPDEPPQAIVFVRQGQDLIPSPTVKVENKKTLLLHLLANDDIELKKIELVHNFGKLDETLLLQKLKGQHFKQDELLSMDGWKGGEHRVFLRAYDDVQKVESEPVIIFYADEEYLRKKRIADLRAFIDEWVHVLADLLESNESHHLLDSLGNRLNSMEFPGPFKESLMDVYVNELKHLAHNIQTDIVFGHELSKLPDYISQTEKQILYGLSLIFQERAGDVRASRQALDDTEHDLNQLLQQLKNGSKDVSSLELQQAFEKLMKQLKDLQNKIKNLPQGPSDKLVNRQALKKQLTESQKLQQRIAAIQQMIADGHSAAAIKELESLTNQLGILSKEIERSLQQWQKNLNQGSMQASKNFGSKLEKIRKEEEKLAKETEKIKKEREKLERESQSQWKLMSPKKKQAIKKSLQELSKQQDELKKKFNKLSQEFDSQLKGSKWEPLFRSQRQKELEKRIENKMGDASQSLQDSKDFDALTQEQESAELLRQAEKAQKKMREQVRQQTRENTAASSRQATEKMELLDSKGKGEIERRRKIMNSLRQKVEDQFQSSHERYFEELLQR